jgi:transcription antitermination factor NusG
MRGCHQQHFQGRVPMGLRSRKRAIKEQNAATLLLRAYVTDSSQPNPSWFALQVKPRHEKAVAEALRLKGLQEFCPQYLAVRRWSDRVKRLTLPLFPRYVFCRFDRRDALLALTTPGVTSILGVGKRPVPIADAEMQTLQAIVQSNTPAQPWPFLRIGQSVHLESGPLAGLRGILLEFKSQCRVVVSVTLLQRSVAVEIDRSWLVLDAVSHPQYVLPPVAGSIVVGSRCFAHRS